MGLIRQIDIDGSELGDAEGGVWTRCAICRTPLVPQTGCTDHPGSGVDVRILSAARLTPERRAAVEAELLALVWGDDALPGGS